MSDAPEPTRRDFLMVSAFSGLGVAGAAAAWGLGRTMAPDAATLAGPPRVKVNLNLILEGMQVTFKLDGKPWAVRHRTKAEIEYARSVALEDLNDPVARNDMLDPLAPATDENRTATPDGRFIVQLLLCTHLGCVPIGDRAGDFDGWFCPCHGSHFDPAGRVRKGVAPRNMAVPWHEVSPDLIMTFYSEPPRAINLDKMIYG
jgi:ubiquinol-cytochrome c reductase iron-sulfur subunit